MNNSQIELDRNVENHSSQTVSCTSDNHTVCLQLPRVSICHTNQILNDSVNNHDNNDKNQYNSTSCTNTARSYEKFFKRYNTPCSEQIKLKTFINITKNQQNMIRRKQSKTESESKKQVGLALALWHKIVRMQNQQSEMFKSNQRKQCVKHQHQLELQSSYENIIYRQNKIFKIRQEKDEQKKQLEYVRNEQIKANERLHRNVLKTREFEQQSKDTNQEIKNINREFINSLFAYNKMKVSEMSQRKKLETLVEQKKVIQNVRKDLKWKYELQKQIRYNYAESARWDQYYDKINWTSEITNRQLYLNSSLREKARDLREQTRIKIPLNLKLQTLTLN